MTAAALCSLLSLCMLRWLQRDVLSLQFLNTTSFLGEEWELNRPPSVDHRETTAACFFSFSMQWHMSRAREAAKYSSHFITLNHPFCSPMQFKCIVCIVVVKWTVFFWSAVHVLCDLRTKMSYMCISSYLVQSTRHCGLYETCRRWV